MCDISLLKVPAVHIVKCTENIVLINVDFNSQLSCEKAKHVTYTNVLEIQIIFESLPFSW